MSEYSVISIIGDVIVVNADTYNIQDDRLVLILGDKIVAVFNTWRGIVKTEYIVNNNQKGRV